MIKNRIPKYIFLQKSLIFCFALLGTYLLAMNSSSLPFIKDKKIIVKEKARFLENKSISS